MAHQALVQTPKHPPLPALPHHTAAAAADELLPPPRLLRVGQRRVRLDSQHRRHQPGLASPVWRRGGGAVGRGAIGAVPGEGGGDGGGRAGEADGVPGAAARAAEEAVLLRRGGFADHADAFAVAGEVGGSHGRLQEKEEGERLVSEILERERAGKGREG